MTKPIVIMGPGRSGTTYLSRVLNQHPELFSINQFQGKMPRITLFSTLYRLEKFLPNRFSPYALESYKFWLTYLEKFNDEYIPSDKEIKRLIKVFQRMKAYSGRNRFFFKITFEARKTILDKIFSPNGYYVVNIERNPVAVVYSIMKQRWWFKDKEKEYEKTSDQEKHSFYVKSYKKSFKSRYTAFDGHKYSHSCKLENLMENPEATMRTILKFLNLPSAKFDFNLFGFNSPPLAAFKY